jgi:KipI family sensor histidine kinase inhibitor
LSNGITILESPRVSYCGDHGLLLEAEGDLALPTQERIWAVNEVVLGWTGVLDTQPGMNSLLVLIQTDLHDPVEYRDRLLRAWGESQSGRRPSKLLEVGVVYGGEGGGDLPDVARFHGVDIAEIVQLHSAAEYTIFAPGTGPGFGYLFGLDPRLFIPRRKMPVMRKVGGTVSIAGVQAILGGPKHPNAAATAPTGWHVIGRAHDVPVPFDIARDPMSIVSLGDRVRFRIERIER